MNNSAPTIRPHGRHIAQVLVCVSSVTVLLAGCGTSGKSTANSDAGAPPASSGAAGDDTPAASSGGGNADAAAIDVCALLMPADAQTIGSATTLSPLPNVTYKLMTEMPMKTATSSSCTLTVYNELPDGTSGNEAIVTVQVEPATDLPVGATKIPGGPGDGAYQDPDGGDFDWVVSGKYLFRSTQSQGASRGLIDNMYRAMIANLKKQLGSS